MSPRAFSELVFLALAALLFDAPLAVSQVNIPMKNSASELADKLRKLGVKKVAVLPLAFVRTEPLSKSRERAIKSTPSQAVLFPVPFSPPP